MSTQRCLCAFICILVLSTTICGAQDYDDEGYGNQGGNQGDGDSYGNDDNYNGNLPNYQQNVESEGSNNNPNNYSPQSGSDPDGDYEGDEGSAAASSLSPTVVRIRRSVPDPSPSITKSAEAIQSSDSAPKMRVKRHGKYYIGPVYTYVKTDKHANFKWGVKHKVGKKHHG